MKHDHSHMGLDEREIRAISEGLELTGSSELATYPLEEDRTVVGLLVATSGGLMELGWTGYEIAGSLTPWRHVRARIRWTTTFKQTSPSEGPAGGRATTIGTLELPDSGQALEYHRERDEEWRDFARVVREEAAGTRIGGR